MDIVGLLLRFTISLCLWYPAVTPDRLESWNKWTVLSFLGATAGLLGLGKNKTKPVYLGNSTRASLFGIVTVDAARMLPPGLVVESDGESCYMSRGSLASYRRAFLFPLLHVFLEKVSGPTHCFCYRVEL